MKISGVHVLLTYQCTFECDHCFVWGSPFQSGTLNMAQIEHILQEAQSLGSVEWFYLEGGEPFLFYPTFVNSVRKAAEMGFKVGVVTNGYWATSLQDAVEGLRPLAGLVADLSVSSDLFHYSEQMSRQAERMVAAADVLGIPVGVISIEQPAQAADIHNTGQIPLGESGVMYRGRAAEKLAGSVRHYPWTEFTSCPEEDLRNPGRVHVDPLGEIHVCQGISIGNLFERPLAEIISAYDPDKHPIAGPLLAGGPAQLARQYNLQPEPTYADACHLCYTTRIQLRERFPDVLLPDQVYGIMGA